jgi:hypothetical protein
MEKERFKENDLGRILNANNLRKVRTRFCKIARPKSEAPMENF